LWSKGNINNQGSRKGKYFGQNPLCFLSPINEDIRIHLCFPTKILVKCGNVHNWRQAPTILYSSFTKWVKLAKNSKKAGGIGLDLRENRDVLRDFLGAVKFHPF